ncbi:alpha/beta hydrolase family protein [Paenibacillus sepulcri]|uniref:Alpha/beta hydrolase n=1 Tax=Paenibacillus sepulcri TaxID=359917 RepID=A0ABS7C5Z8_9BACL|nr:alpha/beta hydrolase [Paenibacillus sepulcri]
MGDLSKQSFSFSLGENLYLRGDVRVIEDGRRKPVIIAVHGFKGFKDWGFFPYLCEQFAERGYAVISFNFSCNGVGETDFDELDKYPLNTYSREQSDLKALLDYLMNGKLPFSQDCDLSRISLIGHSRGGGNSIIYAAQDRRVAAVVTWNGVAKADLFDAAFRSEVMERGIGYVINARTKQEMPVSADFFHDLDANRERFDIPSVLAGLPIPVLVLQGDQDAARLLTGFRKLQTAAPNQHYATVAGGTHTFGAVHPFAGTTEELEQAIAITDHFLARHLPGVRSE